LLYGQLADGIAGFLAAQGHTAADPDAVLLSFLQSTDEAAAELGHWDLAALEVGGQS